jgi:outer membrane beta-barrel protein
MLWHVRAGAALGASLIAVIALVLVPTRASAQCVDENLKEELIGSRHYRGVQDRLFTKALRHEISAMGGWYAADLFSGAPTYGAAYTFHFSEDLGLEASYMHTRRHNDLIDAFQQAQVVPRQLIVSESALNLYFGHLVWSLAYGKLRWLGDGITRFDFYVALGAGVTDDGTGRGLTGSGGFGLKIYIGKWFAVRLDVRDHVLSQEVLGVSQIVNDIVATGGFSVFIPFSG